MSRQRKTSILDDLIAAPWWISFILGAGVAIYLIATPALSVEDGLKYVPRLVWKFGMWLFFFCSLISFLLSFKRRAQYNAAKTLENIRDMSWRDFETFVGEYFRIQGYYVQETGGGGADGGIDLVLRKGSEKVLVQCKQWRTYQVGVKIVREMYGLMMAEHANRVIIVSVGAYTKDAADFARGKPIELIDGDKLVQLRTEQGKESGKDKKCEVKPACPPPENPSCPKCGAEMSLRTAKKGANAGNQFWGCSRYPACKGIVSA